MMLAQEGLRYFHIGLKEVDDWSCCGASAAHTLDEKRGTRWPSATLPGRKKSGLISWPVFRLLQPLEDRQ